jgi:hypothetical protein
LVQKDACASTTSLVGKSGASAAGAQVQIATVPAIAAATATKPRTVLPPFIRGTFEIVG